MDSYEIPRHKVFISFHNADERFKDYLVQLREYNFITNQYQNIFDDYSVGDGDIDDTKMTDEQIRVEIRDNFIKGASVLILLCGEHIKERKFVDWEIHASMFHTDNNPKMGIVVINLPTIQGKNCIHAGQEDEKPIISGDDGWFRIETRSDFERKYPYLPSRLIDNLESESTDSDIVHITVVDWVTIENNKVTLKKIIDNAYNRSRDKNKHYNHSSPLRCRNS